MSLLIGTLDTIVIWELFYQKNFRNLFNKIKMTVAPVFFAFVLGALGRVFEIL